MLEAMARGGAAIDPSQGGIRVSFGRETSAEEIDRFIAAFASFWAAGWLAAGPAGRMKSRS